MRWLGVWCAKSFSCPSEQQCWSCVGVVLRWGWGFDKNSQSQVRPLKLAYLLIRSERSKLLTAIPSNCVQSFQYSFNAYSNISIYVLIITQINKSTWKENLDANTMFPKTHCYGRFLRGFTISSLSNMNGGSDSTKWGGNYKRLTIKKAPELKTPSIKAPGLKAPICGKAPQNF